METEPRFMLTCLHETDKMEDGTYRFIPCMIKEGVSGYFPMRGSEPLQSPWYFGDSHKKCMSLCKDYNFRLGLSDKDQQEILFSSMTAPRD